MNGGHEQERYEVLEVAFSNAGAHPWTMMVLILDADAALTAVKSPGRSHNHACRTQ